MQQKLRRNQQKFGWIDLFEIQRHQVALLQKLYAKNGFTLELTCNACPEQYDVFRDGEQVACLRLRNGLFRVECPDVMGEVVFHGYPGGDGCFDNIERVACLVRALREIQRHYLRAALKQRFSYSGIVERKLPKMVYIGH